MILLWWASNNADSTFFSALGYSAVCRSDESCPSSVCQPSILRISGGVQYRVCCGSSLLDTSVTLTLCHGSHFLQSLAHTLALPFCRWSFDTRFWLLRLAPFLAHRMSLTISTVVTFFYNLGSIIIPRCGCQALFLPHRLGFKCNFLAPQVGHQCGLSWVLPLPTFGMTSFGFLFLVPVGGWNGWGTAADDPRSAWLLRRLDRRQRQGSFACPNLSVRCQDRRLSRDNWLWCDFWFRSGCSQWDVGKDGWTQSGCGSWLHCSNTGSIWVLNRTRYIIHEAGHLVSLRGIRSSLIWREAMTLAEWRWLSVQIKFAGRYKNKAPDSVAISLPVCWWWWLGL